MIALLFSLLLALVASDASATTVNQTFRVYHHTDLEDVGGGEDYFTTNSHYLARFAYVRLYDAFDASGFGDEWDDFAGPNGVDQ